jgi:hypothetical protein
MHKAKCRKKLLNMNIFASIPHVWQWQLNQTSQMHSSTHAWSDLHGSGN